MSTSTAQGILVLAVLALGLFGGWWYVSSHMPAPPIACTAEAMQCPDGSYVGRSGPNCEFVCPTPDSASSTTTPQTGGFAQYNSGISGTITVGPTCPVERTPPDPACADKPLATTVAIFRSNDPVHPFALTRSAADGTFKISLPPGDYVVGAGESALPRCPQTPASVGATGYTKIALSCDSGIR